MSTQYFAYVNEQEYGPIDFNGLLTLQDASRVNDETLVRFSDKTDWMAWRDAKRMVEEEKEKRALEAKEHALRSYERSRPRELGELELIRKTMRSASAYPALRGCVVALIALSSIGLLLSIFAAFSTDNRVLGIVGVATSIGSIFSTLILGVLLDIADAALRKIE